MLNPKNAFKNREVFVVNEAMNKEPQACSRPREGERAEGITLRQIAVLLISCDRALTSTFPIYPLTPNSP